MFPKLSLLNIFKNHFESLKTFGTISDIETGQNGKHTIRCFLAFILIPVCLTYIFYMPSGRIEKETVSMILNANSIFVGLLLNLIVLLYSMKDKVSKQEDTKKEKPQETDKQLIEIKKRVIDFTFANVSFQIILSLLIVILTLIHSSYESEFWITYIDTIVIFLMIQVVLGVILILSRLSTLFSTT